MNFNDLTQPTNKNLLQTNKFVFTVMNMPNLVYYAQSVVMPGVSFSEVPVETPFSATFRHGDKLQYEPITVTFLIDEGMRVWEETYDWMKGLTYPENFRQYQEQKAKGLYWDGMLEVNTNNHATGFRIKFHNIFPTALGPITFSFSDDPNVVPMTDVTFRYDYFTFERNT